MKEIRANWELIALTILILIIYFGFQPGYGLVQSQSQYSNVIAVEFSGITQNALQACPWIINLSSHEVLGLHEEFRAYFVNEVENESAQYLNIFEPDNFTFRYDGIWNRFKNCRQPYISEISFPYQYDPDVFDPYYGTVYLSYHSDNSTIQDEYNRTIASALEIRFADKWYIERAEIDILIAHSANTPLDSTWFLIGLVTLTILWKGSKRKLE